MWEVSRSGEFAELNNPEETRQLVVQLTGAKFEITNPGRYPLQPENVKWFMWCPEITEMRDIPYLNVVWADKSDNIFLDSMPVGNTTSWVEAIYGEDGARKSMDIDFTVFSKIRNEFERAFPQIGERIMAYEKITNDISARRGVSLEISYYGRKGRATLRLRGKISRGNSPTKSIRDEVESTISALKEAWDQIENYGSERARSRGH